MRAVVAAFLLMSLLPSAFATTPAEPEPAIRTPSAPLDPRALADEATIFVSWWAPNDTGGIPEEDLRYDVVRNDDLETATARWRLVAVDLPDRVFRDVNVTPGRPYEYAVRARNPAVFENFSESSIVSAVPLPVRTSVALRTVPEFPHPGDLVTFVAVPTWNPHTSDVYEFEVRDGAQTYRASGRPPSFEHVFWDADPREGVEADRTVQVTVKRAEFDVTARASLDLSLHEVVPEIEARVDGLTVRLVGSAPRDPAPDDLGYAWTLGDGATLQGVTAMHTYAMRGTYTVGLVATHASGAAGRATVDIEVNAPPSARFNLSARGLSVRAVAERETDGGWLERGAWDWGDGTTSAGLVDEHLYLAPGTYEIRFEATDDRGARGATTRTLRVEAPPIDAPLQEASEIRGAGEASIPGPGASGAIASAALVALALTRARRSARGGCGDRP